MNDHLIPNGVNFAPSFEKTHLSGGESDARSAGLVPFSTSDTRPIQEAFQPSSGDSQLILIDRKAGRLRRMKSGVMTAARLIHERIGSDGGRWRAWMITPTYRPGSKWHPRHITALVKNLRAWATRQGVPFRYVWVAEIQQRRKASGADLSECVHYHLLCWLPARLCPPKPDKVGWWRHGMTQRLEVKRPLKYILKYASKGDDVEFPPGLRLHGCGGLESDQRIERTWWQMPRWVRSLWTAQDRPRRAPGGGFVIRATGAWYPSIYRVFVTMGVVLCTLKDDLLAYYSLDQVAQLAR